MSDAGDGVDGRWVEDMFEGSTRWPRRSCGTAGGAHSQFNRVARQLNERSRETLGFETQAERDLMLVLHRLIEPTANNGHSAVSVDHLVRNSRKISSTESFSCRGDKELNLVGT